MNGRTPVDLGCGPGTLTRKISKWLYHDVSLIGVDRDSAFIEYASKEAQEQGMNNITYIEGDVLKIPLPSDSVDACLSHTVIEHVPNRDFLLEQQRICRSGGMVSVMSSRPEKSIVSTPLSAPHAEMSVREQELWKPIHDIWSRKDSSRGIGNYATDPSLLPILFEELGFVHIEVDAITLPVILDNPSISIDQKLRMVELDRQQAIEGLEMGLNQLDEEYAYAEELKLLICDRYNKRRDLVIGQKRVWDFQIYMLFVVRGMKP
ncbi:class I SAM-dependent methyltransferase [Paenibacillus sp. FSL H7-0350]|uniref:class I SAM-dependent methyltransferase n=1 Tax=Paenibacillus sp. FSL H7-0350 TaxID=2975345 RepID=UPI003158ABD6